MPRTTEDFNFEGGVDVGVGWGDRFIVTFSGVWINGNRWVLYYSAVRGNIDVGWGTQENTSAIAPNLAPVFAYTLADRVYLCSGTELYFSDNTNPTLYNLYHDGSNFISMVNYYSAPEALVAVAAYQGRLAVFSRNTIQIWSISSDPAAFTQMQVLPNIGTIAPLSVQSMGELDVVFLADSGVRSLRVRDSSLNAITTDVGSAIDKEVRQDLIDDANFASACAIREPTSGRYWLFLNGKIHVLSYFPSSKIMAWSEYTPTYFDEGVPSTFTPEKMLVSEGQVYIRTTTGKILRYSKTYDATQVEVELPWLDMGKPARTKVAKSIDAAVDGAWTFYASMDYLSVDVELAEIGTVEDKGSYNEPYLPYSGIGTHIKLKAVSTAVPSAAMLGALTFNFNEGNDK